MTTPLKQLSLDQIEAAFAACGLPRFRSAQVAEWVYKRHARTYAQMTNLPQALRDQLAEAFPLHDADVIARQTSSDGTRKYLLKLGDGTTVETVGIPSEGERLTVCCSSQAGCAMACSFCATGKQGLHRSLFPGELVDQVNVVGADFGRRVTHVVIMGQGEPFANYDHTLAALRMMNNPRLLGIGARHITLSTCGIVPGIERFSHEPEQFTLAVSLHAAVQATRDSLMPRVASWPLPALRETLERYTRETGRRVSLEYALIEGVNADSRHLDALIDFCRGLLCHVNLIMLNAVPESPFHPVPARVRDEWLRALEKAGVAATGRISRGSDIDGACGQLANGAANREAAS
ncbi:23S rRNA (adenine(2503)-C(2))-methyltransferase RlmN [Berryella wangjianweii]|uniref:Probable dual-specificity RNA methyltransferase RlmN n=1 Tax=Berryella wangjianweii TaxID=2734634 RepID=A0A6M8J892_9ACTN|nr:23S rRNA (adenine(2503)-C(2))-methyltransferase RlmN [Berryella wangjianweii]QKF07609.1 23S rRNA (adenine(2503)-C(2))-methyltransferase RlmN [Berryella wangjianweii]